MDKYQARIYKMGIYRGLIVSLREAQGSRDLKSLEFRIESRINELLKEDEKGRG